MTMVEKVKVTVLPPGKAAGPPLHHALRQVGRGSTELSTLSAGAGVAACLPSMSRIQIWRTLRKTLLYGAYSSRVNHSA